MDSPIRVRYQTLEVGSVDIHVCTLRDIKQFYDPDGAAKKMGISSATWPLFGIIWPSSLVLAHFMADYDTAGKRVLEIGCGIGLPSLVLNKQNADITATDYHPETGNFLLRNAQLNNSDAINYQQVDWADQTRHLGQFDLIIGSDLLYEDEHIKLLARFIERHAAPDCKVILVDPGRGRKNKISVKMEKFGYRNTHIRPDDTSYLDQPFKGHILKFKRKGEQRVN
ncbi:class I SAM-dependent methyltransferase [Marinobacter sp. X15-166B]|uniref:class I SAM-dependent methyltransferase n=1 Tax=Marinobacter sp. X15-166B TaxID=1897620 RepID=UPI00085BFE90|nr:methyltransferase domain-containing protein [Marinobacter sp. X15-166B]OEY65171.1 histidine kinase [Marinobacter sp. X15-166B]